jgi:hypothetical protein
MHTTSLLGASNKLKFNKKEMKNNADEGFWKYVFIHVPGSVLKKYICLACKIRQSLLGKVPFNDALSAYCKLLPRPSV